VSNFIELHESSNYRDEKVFVNPKHITFMKANNSQTTGGTYIYLFSSNQVLGVKESYEEIKKMLEEQGE